MEDKSQKIETLIPKGVFINHPMGLSDLCLGIHKITIKCPKALRTFEYVVMLFRLKNAKATYQHSMNVIFHDLIGKIMKVYIDDIVVQGSIGKKTATSLLFQSIDN